MRSARWGCSRPFPVEFWIPMTMEVPLLLWTPVPVPGHPFSLYLIRIFHVPTYSWCLTSLPCVSLRRFWFCIHYNLPVYIPINCNIFLYLSPLRAKQTHLSQFVLICPVLHLVDHHGCSVLDLFQYVNIVLVLGKLKLQSAPKVVPQEPKRGEESPCWICCLCFY